MGEEKGRRRRHCILLYRCDRKAAEGGGEGSLAAARRTGLERRSGGAVGRQRPEAGRHGQATHVRVAGAEQGRGGG
jgi:hypothetical protein